MAKKKAPAAPADFYVAVSGSVGQREVDEPQLGQQVEYTAFGTVTAVHETIRDDGETRLSYTVTPEALWPKGSKRPDTANQASMVDHTGKVNPEAAGQEADDGDGDELIDTKGGDDE